MTLRVALYLRQSMDRTGEEEGVDRQRDDAMRMINARGWTVVREYIDNDVSASSKKPRPQFVDMMKHVDDGAIDVIVSKHMDRLLRQPIELEDVLQRCEKIGAWIVTSADGIDTSTDGGRTVARIMVSIAKGEMERKGARHKAANKQAAEAGKWSGGRRPFGYEKDGMTICESEAALVRQGYADVLAGVSLSEISRRWVAAGGLTTQGKQWRPTSVKDVLTNPRHAGLRRYMPGAEQIAAKRRNPEAGVIGKASWPPLVDEATWRAAVRILSNPARHRSTPGKALLTGVIVCGVCGSGLRRGGNGTGRILYKCVTGTHVARSCDIVDAFVEATILRAYRRPEVAHLFAREDALIDVQALTARAGMLRDRLRDIKADYAQAFITRDEWLEMRALTQDSLTEVQAQLAQAGGSDAVAKLLAAEDMQAEWDDYSLTTKRGLIGLLCTVVLHPAGRGARGFDEETVTFDPKRKDAPIIFE